MSLPDDLDLAGEYVLGTLPLPDRLAFETRLKSDAGLALAVADWEMRLEGLNEFYAESPAPDLLPRIEARLFARPARLSRGWFGWLAGAATAAMLALTTVALLPPPAPPVVATLGSTDAPLRFEAHYDGTALIVQRIAGALPAQDQSHELWIIAPEATPVSLGLIGDTPLRVPYPEPPPGWVLAVTVEPAGGAPQGLPTGPIVASGEISL